MYNSERWGEDWTSGQVGTCMSIAPISLLIEVIWILLLSLPQKTDVFGYQQVTDEVSFYQSSSKCKKTGFLLVERFLVRHYTRVSR